MKFHRVVGKVDKNLVIKAQEKLQKVFLELGLSYNNVGIGSNMGGDPLIFTLMYPVQHICTLNIPTAATDGVRFYWNPKFLLKHSLRGLRLICVHEAWHAIYTHPRRRGSRNPKLWNIAIDYIVNSNAMDDLVARKIDAHVEFTKHLGRYMTLDNFMLMVKDPFVKIPGFDDIDPTMADPNAPSKDMPAPNEDRELTPRECQELEKREKGVRFFYADPNLTADMRRPEKIYDILFELLPKCGKCGRLGMYKKPGKASTHSHGDDPCDCPKHGKGCDECMDDVDVFGLGGTIDEHMDSEESEENMAKRISEAIDTARKMAGRIPAALESELGKLTAPRITWKDVVRSKLLKARAGSGRNDWTNFRTRPMFSGLLSPKNKSHSAHFGCLLDTSGSMSRDDMALGVSQLCSLDERSEGTITCADSDIYWDKSIKLRKINQEELRKIKPVGRGGTIFADYFTDYQKNIGKCDLLIVITDGFLDMIDVANMKNPGVEVVWLITSGSSFTAPFGRVFSLKA